MPIYQFAHPEHPLIIDVVQSMKEPHIYIDEEGVEWRRVWSTPQTSFNTRTDPFSTKGFINKDHDGRTMGDLWDESNELSQKRADKNGGLDPVKEKYEQQYANKRGNKRHRDSGSQS